MMTEPQAPAEPAEPTTPEPTTPPARTEADKTFSQADLERIIGERLAKDRQQRGVTLTEGRLKELNDKARRFDELEEQSKTDLQKAREAAEQAAKERDEAVQTAHQTLVKASVIAEAAKQGAVDTDAVVALLPKDAVTVGDDGQVTGAVEAVKALLDSKKFLVGDTRPSGSADQGARPGGANQLTREDLASMSPEEIRKATAEGRLTNVLGAS